MVTLNDRKFVSFTVDAVSSCFNERWDNFASNLLFMMICVSSEGVFSLTVQTVDQKYNNNITKSSVIYTYFKVCHFTNTLYFKSVSKEKNKYRKHCMSTTVKIYMHVLQLDFAPSCKKNPQNKQADGIGVATLDLPLNSVICNPPPFPETT